MDELTRAHAHPSVWLQATFNKDLTAKIRRKLRHRFPDAATLALTLNPETQHLLLEKNTLEPELRELLVKKTQNARSQQRIEQALAWEASSAKHHLIGLDHPLYPKALASTADAPFLLYAVGTPQILLDPCIAIVGARKASRNAIEQTHEIAEQLAAAGLNVVSGMAVGIDAAAHRGCLKGGSATIAVQATPPNRVYPAAHRQLAEEISENGLLVTEFPLATALQPSCFPRRNRIISAISLGVLVIEAGLPSGTLTTAKHAMDQGREVMAMPGSVLNPLTKGSHELIKQGAALVENAEDVLSCIASDIKNRYSLSMPSTEHCKRSSKAASIPTSALQNDADALTLLDCLGFDPASVDTLVRRSGLAPSQVSGALISLEISGNIVQVHGGRYSRCKHS